MRVLALDTATPRTAVALRDVDSGANVCMLDEVDLSANDDPPAGATPGHARRVLALITELLEQAGGLERVDRIAVGVGPGTFTGLRIGIATAQALAAASAKPLVGVSTLASLQTAALARLPEHRPVLAVIDARRGEAFVAGDGLAPCVVTPQALVDVAGQRAGDGVVAVGDGALRYRELLERAGAHVPAQDTPVHRVSARTHCLLAATLEPVPDGRVQPLYLRAPDAEVARR